MWLNKITILAILFFKFSNGYSFAKNFEKITFPEPFAECIQDYITILGNETSQQCKSQLLQYGKSLIKLSPWALLMFDAGTKIPSGVLSGNLVGLGDFDQCLNIKGSTSNGSIYGKHCLGEIPLLSLNGKDTKSFNKIQNVAETPETRMINVEGGLSAAFSTCVPHLCSTTDIQRLYSWCGVNVKFEDNLCQSKLNQPKLTGGDIATITFLSAVLCIMLASTVYDVFVLYLNKKPAHSILIAFSILTNGKKLIATSKSSSQISCLHGIRVISMMWVVLSHRYAISLILPKINTFSLIQWMFDEKNMFIMGATVSVDTFFVLGGLLVSYGFMSAMAKGVKFNIIMYYVHRYLRLTPLLAVIILIYVTILKHLGSGPLWSTAVTMLSSGCKEHWWSALLYIHNYVNVEDMCVGQTWYLAVDTQLFLLSPIILVPLTKMPSAGILTAAAFTLLSMLASFLVAWMYEIRGLLVANRDDSFSRYYYYATHTRAGPWLMGIMLGYCIYKIKDHKKISINTLTAAVLWVVSLAILCACVFAGHNTLTEPYDRLANSFFVALVRPGWSLGLCWVIFACVIGYGGPVNWFLSLPVFQVVSKLTYSMYLIHFAMEVIVSAQMRSAPDFSTLQMLYTFWGDLVFTLATALIFTLAFESPIIALEKAIFGNEKEKKTPQKENRDIEKVERP